MAIKQTRWRPDTCACEYVYEWDDQADPETRTHTPISVDPCAIHIGEATIQARYDRAILHNRRKNRIHQAILDNIAGIRDTILRDDGTTYYQFKPGKSINWTLNMNGTMSVRTTGFTAAQISAAQTWVNNNLPGEITIS